ncbi:MAG: PKD domain-containing protein, partial [Bacteroidales bacterium]|nr:PKD domain-containing protein [Bacteroidales bacterium]
EEENRNPTVSSVVVNPATVNAGQTATVTVTASDPDGDGLSYAYTVSGGAIAPSGNTATWTAPATAGAYSVTVTVSDGKGGSASSNGSLTVNAVVQETKITGTAHFSAGSPGDLANSKVSIYTSWDNWFYNQPVKFTNAQGTGANVTFTISDVNPGNYYLDVWKDNDFSADWTIGDYVGWYGSGGLGSPNLTEFQIAEGQTFNCSIDMYVVVAKGAKPAKH